MGLLAVVGLLLQRYSRQDDFAIGVPIWGRNHPDLEPLIGFFINMLPIRIRFEDDPCFRQLLAQVRQTSLAAYDHQELPFERMVEALQRRAGHEEQPAGAGDAAADRSAGLGLERISRVWRLGPNQLPLHRLRLDLEFFLRRKRAGCPPG